MSLTQRQINRIKELLNEILLKFHATLTTAADLESEKKRRQNDINSKYRNQYEIEDCNEDNWIIANCYAKKIATTFAHFLTFCKIKTRNLRQFVPDDLTGGDYTLLKQILPELSFIEFSLLLTLLTSDEQKHALILYKKQETAAPNKHSEIGLSDLIAIVNIAEVIQSQQDKDIRLQEDNYVQWKSLCQDKLLLFLESTQQDFLKNISSQLDFFQQIIPQAKLEQLLINAINDPSSFTVFSEEIAAYLSNNCRKNILNLLIQKTTLLTILQAKPLQNFCTEISGILDTEQKKVLIDQWIASGDLIVKLKQESVPWSFFYSNLTQHLTPEQKQQIKKRLLAELSNDFSDICFLKKHFNTLDRQEQKQILHAIGNSSNPKVIKYFLVWTISTLDTIQKARSIHFEEKASINHTIRVLKKINTEKALLERESIKNALSELLNSLYLIEEKYGTIAGPHEITPSASQQISQLLELFEPVHLQENENNQQIYTQLNPIVAAAKTKQWQTSGIPDFFRKCSFNYYRPRETWRTNTIDTLIQLWEKGARLEGKRGYCDWKQIKQQMFNLLEKSSKYSPSFFLGRAQDSITAYEQFKEQIRLIN